MRGKTVSFDEAISGVCYYFMRLPRRGFASPRNEALLRGSIPPLSSRDLIAGFRLKY
ncbi:hypothetical protein [Rickettsia tamurae]|uniref:hypothetical protein n=1 Tax=Rickettsia tamurae TaxID=334545 RepID=UPI000AD42AA4|nr:hypothetical protein [Rickettsia tamurae]